ncbi:MAG: TatD family hydrolase [Sterolibacterium sp.]|nr:TatD family hydrolase [Sterolibacterium sp.]MBP9799154.1 TatD family hydrolase [Sterolibacterium sp.]
MYADSHCHLDFPELSGRMPEILSAMRQRRVCHALCAGVTLERFPAIRALAEAHAGIFAAVGVHPDTDEAAREPDVATLVELAQHPKVVAIGETGLDYYRLTGDLEWQRERFRVHIRAARQVGKPLIIHTRSAAEDTLRLMREERADEVGGVMHCFTESQAVADEALALGFHISFSGIVTFKNALALKEVARQVPLDRLLIETDAPYLAPVPYRGKLNEPSYVVHVAEEISRLRGLDVEQVGQASTENFLRLFRIDGQGAGQDVKQNILAAGKEG